MLAAHGDDYNTAFQEQFTASFEEKFQKYMKEAADGTACKNPTQQKGGKRRKAA